MTNQQYLDAMDRIDLGYTMLNAKIKELQKEQERTSYERMIYIATGKELDDLKRLYKECTEWLNEVIEAQGIIEISSESSTELRDRLTKSLNLLTNKAL